MARSSCVSGCQRREAKDALFIPLPPALATSPRPRLSSVFAVPAELQCFSSAWSGFCAQRRSRVCGTPVSDSKNCQKVFCFFFLSFIVYPLSFIISFLLSFSSYSYPFILLSFYPFPFSLFPFSFFLFPSPSSFSFIFLFFFLLLIIFIFLLFLFLSLTLSDCDCDSVLDFELYSDSVVVCN